MKMTLIKQIYNYSSILRCSMRSLDFYPKHFTRMAPRVFLQSTVPVLSSARNFWEAFPCTRLHEKDGVPNDLEIIYRPKYFNYAFYGQLFSLTALAAQIIGGLYNIYLTEVSNEVLGSTKLGVVTFTYDLVNLSAVAFFTLQSFLLFMAAQNAVLRIYYNEKSDEYIFVSLSLNPFVSRLTYCKPGELKELKINHIGSIFGTHILKDRRAFIRFYYFKTVSHYNRLLLKI